MLPSEDSGKTYSCFVMCGAQRVWKNKAEGRIS